MYTIKNVTIKDIARISGYGVSTVSRAINDHPDINKKTKEIIMDIVDEYNFIPNSSARNLKITSSNSIAVLVKGISNHFFNNLLDLLEKEITQKKFTFILHHVEENDNEIDVAVQIANEKKLDGIIFLGGSFNYDDAEMKLKKLTIPFVLSTSFPTKELKGINYSVVSVDHYKESYRIVDYLCKLNHKKIAIISASKNDKSIGKQRLEGYKDALTNNNIEINEDLIRYVSDNEKTYSMINGYLIMNELLDSKIEFTAVYGISDSIVIGSSKSILERGYRIPEDYSVAGFDGIDISYYYSPSITTMRQPVEDIAKETVKILFKMLDNNNYKEVKLLDAVILKRSSTLKI